MASVWPLARDGGGSYAAALALIAGLHESQRHPIRLADC